jgi:3-oxoacyl-(acyl-carrier-protein) synthase
MECVAALLQYREKRFFGNTNAEDLHPEIEKHIHRDCVPVESTLFTPGILAKASFGFGDVNSCLIFGPV